LIDIVLVGDRIINIIDEDFPAGDQTCTDTEEKKSGSKRKAESF